MSKDPVIWLDEDRRTFLFWLEIWLYLVVGLGLVWASLKGYIPPLRLGP